MEENYTALDVIIIRSSTVAPLLPEQSQSTDVQLCSSERWEGREPQDDTGETSELHTGELR